MLGAANPGPLAQYATTTTTTNEKTPPGQPKPPPVPPKHTLGPKFRNSNPSAVFRNHILPTVAKAVSSFGIFLKMYTISGFGFGFSVSNKNSGDELPALLG